MAATGCGIGEQGIDPPTDRIFYPASVAVDPSGAWLYVVNSNSDLRYNAGTVVAVDLARAAGDRGRTDWGRCPRNNFVPGNDSPPQFCCRDFLDDRVLNCDERAYVEEPATVRIASFGGLAVQQSFTRGGEGLSRLYIAVRADPSITFVDATVRNGRARLRCSGPITEDAAPPEDNPRCADTWKIRQGDTEQTRLIEEPYTMSLDPKLGILYVGHLTTVTSGQTFVAGGISVIDVCAPGRQAPRLASLTNTVFAGAQAHATTALTPIEPGNPLASVFATSRFTAQVAELKLRGVAPVDCTLADAAGGRRDLALVPGPSFYATQLGTRSGDVRGLAFSSDGNQAFVLHRQFDSQGGDVNPPALVVIDRRPDARGEPVNRLSDVVEVCRGPTRLRWHDAGRGPRLFVNCFEGGQIYVVDPRLPAVDAVIEAGNGPADVVFSATDPTVGFIAGFADNDVAVVDLKPGSPNEFRVVQRIGFPRRAAASFE